MITVNIHEAKTNLSKLIAAAEEKGETIRICRNGKEIVEMKAISENTSEKQSKKKRNIFNVNPELKVTFYEDPMLPTDPEGWPVD